MYLQTVVATPRSISYCRSNNDSSDVIMASTQKHNQNAASHPAIVSFPTVELNTTNIRATASKSSLTDEQQVTSPVPSESVQPETSVDCESTSGGQCLHESIEDPLVSLTANDHHQDKIKLPPRQELQQHSQQNLKTLSNSTSTCHQQLPSSSNESIKSLTNNSNEFTTS